MTTDKPRYNINKPPHEASSTPPTLPPLSVEQMWEQLKQRVNPPLQMPHIYRASWRDTIRHAVCIALIFAVVVAISAVAIYLTNRAING